MLAAAADHLWQSLLFFALGGTLASVGRRNSAEVRSWLWRICAAKFAVPFAWLFALGAWLGLPGRFSGEPAPELLTRTAAAMSSWVAPLQSAPVSRTHDIVVLLALSLTSAVCVRLALRAIDIERARLQMEWARGESAPPLPLGFFKAALFTSCALAAVMGPLFGGATQDRNRRYALLLENVRILREAPVQMAIAAPGMGERMRIVARYDGLLIRNINIRELIAVSNGVTPYDVGVDQMFSSDADPGRNSWVLWPRYDLRVRAAIREPGEFDPFALRQRITRLLVERFGLEINVNGKCQLPCGRWDTRRDERPL